MVISFLETGGRLSRIIIGIIVIPLLLTNLLFQYLSYYNIVQKRYDHDIEQVSAVVKSHVKKDDVLYIYGCDWNASIPYYSERKAIMDRSNYSIADDKFKRSMSMMGGKKVGAMVYKGNKVEKKFMEKVELFKMHEYKMNIPGWKLFLPKN